MFFFCVYVLCVVLSVGEADLLTSYANKNLESLESLESHKISKFHKVFITRPQAMLVAVGQKSSGESWSKVCWRQLKMCPGLPRNTGVERDLVIDAAGDSAVKEKQRCWNPPPQKKKKTGRMVAARTNIRRPRTSPNMLFIWQNPRLNKKSKRTFHPAILTFSASPTKWAAKTWMSKARNLSRIMLESCAWVTGLNKLPRM